jgi:hypothetical protein
LTIGRAHKIRVPEPGWGVLDDLGSASAILAARVWLLITQPSGMNDEQVECKLMCPWNSSLNAESIQP